MTSCDVEGVSCGDEASLVATLWSKQGSKLQDEHWESMFLYENIDDERCWKRCRHLHRVCTIQDLISGLKFVRNFLVREETWVRPLCYFLLQRGPLMDNCNLKTRESDSPPCDRHKTGIYHHLSSSPTQTPSMHTEPKSSAESACLHFYLLIISSIYVRLLISSAFCSLFLILFCSAVFFLRVVSGPG